MSGSDAITPVIIMHGTTVLERVLLAIINAHTNDATEGRQSERLQAAMNALIGPVMRNGHDMDKALLFMVRQRQKDVCDFEMGALRKRADGPMRAARSVPELASVAAREVLGCTSVADVRATARVLCNMFNKRYNAYRVEPDHVRDALEAETVQRILVELSEWDILSTCQR